MDKGINLDQTFDSTTLHNGEKRFNISYLEGGSLEHPNYIDEIAWIKVNGVKIDQDKWSTYINVTLEDHVLKYQTAAGNNQIMQLAVQRSYGIIDGQGNFVEEIIGAAQI